MSTEKEKIDEFLQIEERVDELLQTLDGYQKDATDKCMTNGRFCTTGLIVGAWGFLFEESNPYLRSTLIVVIILSVIYFGCDMWRSFQCATYARKLWKEVDLEILTPQKAANLSNEKSQWSFFILKLQLLLLVFTALGFILYCVCKLVVG
ncbi:MAG: hypothetical protein IKK67_01555 [Bacteroidaceae bacterium]|nr:hypothetical protein [Bacteroidaceae bacterium]